MTNLHPIFEDLLNAWTVEPYKHSLMRVQYPNRVSDEEITLTIPGLKKEDIKVEVDNLKLTVTTTDNRWVYKLPDTIDVKSITAKYEAGILYISTPKKSGLVRSIKVE